jgi:predicted dehydrogenase
MMINIGVIGYGYWGPNLVRNFMEVPGAKVTTVCDQKPERLNIVRSRYPTIKTTSDYGDLLSDPILDAIVIATPVSSHFELALQALQANKHIFVEKPLTNSSEDALRLIDEAENRKRVLLVDHTFVYTSAVRKIHELVNNGDLGTLLYYDSTRVNLGLFQHDVNVIWDLAVHDLSIIDYLFQEKPYAVSATGISHVEGQPENLAYLTLFFSDSLIAHINVNWLSPVKVRRTLIGGSRKMIVYDDVEPSEKIKIYDKGIMLNSDHESIYKMLISYRTGDMLAPQLDMVEALHAETLHFLECITTGNCPITDGYAGLRIIQILEAATQSLEEKGALVDIVRSG